jgi:hypothetical protein
MANITASVAPFANQTFGVSAITSEQDTIFDIPFTHLPHPATPLWHHDHFIIHPRPPRQKDKPYITHPSKTVLTKNTASIKILFATASSPVTHLKIAMYAIF